MRILFLVLVLVNLAFAAWRWWFSGPELPTRPIRSAAPSIALFTEPGGAPAADVTREPAVAALPDESLPVCLSVGPFPNRVDVGDAAAALSDAGFATAQRTADGDVWLGYWVYLDSIETQTEAAAIVDRLADEGIGEAYVIADGNSGNLVSLGVFSERARSQQRYADVEVLGLTPVITNRSQPGEVFWLDVTAQDGRGFDAAELPTIEVDPQLQITDCPNG